MDCEERGAAAMRSRTITVFWESYTEPTTLSTSNGQGGELILERTFLCLRERFTLSSTVINRVKLFDFISVETECVERHIYF